MRQHLNKKVGDGAKAPARQHLVVLMIVRIHNSLNEWMSHNVFCGQINDRNSLDLSKPRRRILQPAFDLIWKVRLGRVARNHDF